MWMSYNENKPVAKKIKGISKKQSIKADNASGVVKHPATGELIFWQD